MKISRLLPLSLRILLLKTHQRIVFKSAIKQLDLLEKNNTTAKKLLKKLIYGWGNQGWSAQTDYLETCVKYASNSKGAILECGSGLSTIVIGYIAKTRGLKVYSLEHNVDWGNKVCRLLDDLDLNNVTVSINPLKAHKEFDWYDISNISIPNSFDLIICDGPPANTKGGRFGLLPVMGSHVMQGTVILVDDTIRTEEKEMIEKWKEMFSFEILFKGNHDPHAILTIK